MLIQRHGGDLNIINEEGLTPIAYGSERVIEWLALQNGVAMTGGEVPSRDNNELWFKERKDMDPEYNSELRIRQKGKKAGKDALFVESY